MACFSAGLQKRDNLFGKFAVAVITIGELSFTVIRQSGLAVSFQIKKFWTK